MEQPVEDVSYKSPYQSKRGENHGKIGGVKGEPRGSLVFWGCGEGIPAAPISILLRARPPLTRMIADGRRPAS